MNWSINSASQSGSGTSGDSRLRLGEEFGLESYATHGARVGPMSTSAVKVLRSESCDEFLDRNRIVNDAMGDGA